MATQDHEDFYREVFEGVSDAVFVYDPAGGVVVDANPAAAALTGYAVDMLVGRPVTQFSAGDPATVERAAAGLIDRAGSEDQPPVEWSIERADGTIRTTEVSLRRTSVAGEDRVLAIMRDVTERDEERAGRERYRERLTALADASPDVFAMFTGDFEECLFVNDTYETVWKRPTEALERDPEEFLRGIHPDDREAVREALTRLADGERLSMEARLDAATDERWVELVGRSTQETAVEPTRVVVFAHEITTRKRLLTDLSARTEQLSALVDNLPLVLFTLDADGVFVQSRGQGLRDLGREPGAVVGKSVFDVYAENDTITDACRRALDGETTMRTIELGDEIFDAWYEPTRDEQGTVDGVIGVAVNVTRRERLQSEQTANLQALEELHTRGMSRNQSTDGRLQALLDVGRRRLDLPYGFVTRISDGTQHIVAAAGTPDSLQPGATAPLEEAYCRRTIATSGLLGVQNAPEEGWQDDPAYDRFGLNCYLGGKLMVDEKLYGTVCFADHEVRDDAFTDHERAFVELLVQWLGYELERDERETELRALSDELTRQNEQLEEFADVVAHDIRGPLTAARGFFELALETEETEHFEQVERAHARMERLIDDLLTLARDGRSIAEREPVDVASVARDAWPYPHEPPWLELEEGLPTLSGDASRLEQVFSNLYRNAVEHGSREVTVTVGPLYETSESDTPSGFFVADDGPGIPPEKRPLIFDFGYSTSSTGTGLGLAIVREVIEAHGWSVRVSAHSTDGARFEVRTQAQTI